MFNRFEKSNILKRIIGAAALIPAILVFGMGSASAVTARPSIIATATGRMPTISANLSGYSTISTAGTPSTGVVTVTDRECIDAYVGCMKESENCGSGFEECTNNTLFFAKRPNCASTLLQCTTSGVNQLFGTPSIGLLSNQDKNGEYVYPRAGSILGDMIAAAHISNRYDTQTCVRRYTTCLKKDDVCGADFELCTNDREFLKQKLFCESTLARCQDDGKRELYGSTDTTKGPTSPGRLRDMIDEGAALAAVNAVATCYKVADNCILNACARNPYKCKEGAAREIVDVTELINTETTVTDEGGVSTTTTTTTSIVTPTDLGSVNRSEILGFIKNSCKDTIGGNKFCYATFLGNGTMPTASQLRDEDNREDIFAEAYSARFSNSNSMKAKIDELIEKFEQKTKRTCQNTIVNCAMRSCGGGSGLACYNVAASGASADNASIDITKAKASIKSGCEAVVNNDTYCKYAAAVFDANTGAISFEDTSVFEKLFTAPSNTDNNMDPVGAVAALNLKLANSFSPTAMTNMTRQCQNVASSCVKSLCGTDYQNCYRNRTDVLSSISNSGQSGFDQSMNKVGGVLDRVIIVGLCMETVKNNSICDELIKAKAYAASNTAVSTGGAVWGDATTVRGGWYDVGATAANEVTIQDTDIDGNKLCSSGCDGSVGICDQGFTNGSGTYCVYDTPVMSDRFSYSIDQAANQIFQSAINDLEMQAQAQYNAKLTKQQNMCMAGNSAGGIMGAGDIGGVYMWAKLRNNKVPTEYPVAGLKADQFIASNELYGSFCRLRITIQSDDKFVQESIMNDSNMKAASTAYFVAGDTFTCGSWIPQSALNEIERRVVDSKTTDAQRRNRRWIGFGASVLGAVGGGIGANALQERTGLGGLLGTRAKVASQDDIKQIGILRTCVNDFAAAITSLKSDKYYGEEPYTTAQAYTGRAVIYRGTGEAEATATAPIVAAAAAAAMKTTQALCEEQLDDLKDRAGLGDGTASRGNDTRKTWINVGGAAVGGLVTGILTNQAIKAGQENKNEEAAREWMENVGSHIKCYIGSAEVGEYGDVISTELE